MMYQQTRREIYEYEAKTLNPQQDHLDHRPVQVACEGLRNPIRLPSQSSRENRGRYR